MLAVFVNCGTVILGSIIGILFAKKITVQLSEIIQTAAGIVTVVIGLQAAFQYKSIVILSLSLILGGITGSILDLDGKILALGKFIQNIFFKNRTENENSTKKQDSKNNWNFAYAFLNSSVLFCVGAMAILGSFKAGIEKDYTIIFTKSILDGFMSITFAAAMGPGTIFSSVSIFIYQGFLTLLSGFINPYINETILAEMNATGGVLIIMIGISLIGLKKIKTANYLPAILMSVLFVLTKGFIIQHF